MNILRLIWPVVLLVLVLTNCSEFQHYAHTAYALPGAQEYGVDYWLLELHNTRAMTPDEIRQTVTAWEQELHDDPSTGNHIKLALLLTAGDASVRDPKRARELLDGLDPAPDNSSDQELVSILRQIIDEQDQAVVKTGALKKQTRKQSLQIRKLEQQQRAMSNIEQKNQQREIPPDLEDEQDQAEVEISTLKKQTKEQTLRIQELEQQQRALTDIEQNIQQREISPDLENEGQ